MSYYIEYCCLSMNGYYPENLNKQNQDRFICIPDFDVYKDKYGERNMSFFGVFDGHGDYGDKCSSFVSQVVFFI